MNTSSNWKSWNSGQWLAVFFKVLIALAVSAFLALHSLNFFEFVFPPEQFYYAYLGFALTGGAVVAYLVILKWGSHSSMNKSVSIVMLAVSVIAELVTAGFGMQVEAWKGLGYQMTNEDLSSMILVIQGLGLAHALALILQVAGDDIFASFTSLSNVLPTSSPTSISTPHPLRIPPSPTSIPSNSDENFTPKQ